MTAQGDIPTLAAGPPAAPASVWPTVLGVAAIIGGVRGLLGGTWWPAAVQIVGGGFGLSGSLRTQVYGLAGLRVWTVLLSGLWLTAGILLLRRRRVAVALLDVWAALAALTCLARPAFLWVLFSLTSEVWQRTMPFFCVSQIRLAIRQGLTGLAWPIILLAWLSRRSIRREVQSWRPAVARPRPPAGFAWPAVIGLLLLVGGALRLLGGAFDVASWAYLRSAYPDCHVTARMLSQLAFWTLLIEGGLGALALAGAGLLLRRRRAGGVLVFLYALGAAARLYPLAVSAAAILDMQDPTRLLWVAGRLTGSLVRLAWPVFLMIWFLRPEIRTQMRQWKSQRRKRW